MKKNEKLLAQMDFTFVVTEKENNDRFKCNLSYGDGTYGIKKQEDDHDFWYLTEDCFGNPNWAHCYEDADKLNSYLVWKRLK